MYEALIGVAARLVFLCAVIAAFGVFSFTGALLLLLSMATAVLLGLGFGMLLAPFMILFEDLRSTVRLVASYGIFVSPAFYIPHSGLFGTLIQLNPASPIMAAAREAIATGSMSGAAPAVFLVLGIAVILVVLGAMLIRLASPIVIERMLLGGR
jgi:lipopolysaccharide transport system permease protein